MILRRYLHQPQLFETVEGLARWRLLEEAVQRSVEETYDAISWLVSEGFLLEEARVGSEPIFSLNCERAGEAERLLAGSNPRGRPVRGEARGIRAASVAAKARVTPEGKR